MRIKMLKLLLSSFLLFALVKADYCNSPISTDGRRPTDALDAACQRNILCLNALSKCPCIAQYLSALLQINVSTAIINDTYSAYSSCLTNKSVVQPNRYYLGGVMRGLNYLTLWDSAYIIQAYDNVLFYSVNTNDYFTFTSIAYEYAQNIWPFLPYNRSMPQSLLWIEADEVVVVVLNDTSSIGSLDIQPLGTSFTSWKDTIDILTAQYAWAAASSDDWYHQYNDCNDNLNTMQGWYILAWILIIAIFCSMIGGLVYHRRRKNKKDVSAMISDLHNERSETQLAKVLP